MGKITVNMQDLYDRFQKEISTLYTKEDILNKIEEVKDQEGTSAFASRWDELEKMCGAHGIKAEAVYKEREKAEQILVNVPERRTLKRILLKRLHDMYKEYPMSTHFMERLVRNLAKEFDKDSVRMAILKQFVKYTDYGVGSLERELKESFTEEELADYNSKNKKQKREVLIARLNEGMFDRILADSDNLDEIELAELMLRKMAEKDVELEQKEMDFVKSTAAGDEKRGAETFAEIKNIERILLERFGRMEVVKEDGGRTTEAARYEQARKDKRKAKKKKAELFCLADNLASGKFYTNGRTRKELYLFALAFGMTAYIDEEKDIYYEETDFEKNLLFDYYNDNLLRYVSDEEYCRNSTDYEAEPVGEGINYKNYVEIIYLYYMYRRDLKLTPAQKIKKADKLIRLCEETAKKTENRLKEPKRLLTKVYKRNYIKEVLSLDDPKEICDYIVANYHVISEGKQISKPKLLYGGDQYTVKEVHKEIRDILSGVLQGDLAADYEFGMDMNFILAECENWKQTKKVLDEENQKFLELVESFDEDFIRLMQKLGEKMRTRRRGLFKINDKTGYTDRTVFTRTELITICSFCFQYDMDDMAVYSVPELFEEFCRMVDPYLEECRYQKISVKNIFDMYVFYSLILGMVY